MKKLKLGLVALALLVLGANFNEAKAQHDKANLVKFNLISLAFGEIMPSYERAFSDNFSAHIAVPFYSRSASASASGAGSGDASLTGIGVIAEGRFYPSENKAAPKGFYAGPFLVYRSFSLKVDATNSVLNETATAKAGFTVMGGGGMLGHQWLAGDVFVIDLFAGIGYYSGSVKDAEVEWSDGSTESYSGGISVSGTLPRFGFAMGIAF